MKVRRATDVDAAVAGESDSGIREYYERLGFEHRGDKDHPRFAAALYERPVRR